MSRSARAEHAPSLSVDTLATLYERLRTGAANVAGVTFQTAISAMLLAAGRAGSVPGLAVEAVRPEGLEDVDCRLTDGSTLFVQCKERGVGARSIAAAELAEILVHGVRALVLSDPNSPAPEPDGVRGLSGSASGAAPGTALTRLAIVTNGRFGSSLPETGWTRTLDQVLADWPEGESTLACIVAAVERQLVAAGLPAALATELISRVHLVQTREHLGHFTRVLLESGLELHPALAELLRTRLVCDLSEVAAAQRETTLGTAIWRTGQDLEAMAARLCREVDVESLQEAVRAGVCEPVDFLTHPPQDARRFYDGVSVRPGHIAAGLDVLRPVETDHALDGLTERGHVVFAGPSGSGKSALLWRCARLLEGGPQLVRVLRVATPAEAELLVRHVIRAQPSAQSRVVVCVDDLGRPHMAAWAAARERLLEHPGVLVLAAARREDLTPELSLGAALVSVALSELTAEQIYQAVQDSGIPTVLAREEAVARADGLLMEFIALATTGRRLREVLSDQITGLRTPQRRLDRTVLRLVCAAHTLGVEVAADALPAVVGQPADLVGDALERLADEHLVVNEEGIGWKGLHDLRTQVLLQLLHTSPPPTLAATYAETALVLPVAARPAALRRAASHIATAAATAQADDLAGDERLAGLQQALRPLSHAIANQLRACVTDPPCDVSAAAHAAGLLETADRLDTLAHLHAALPLVERQCPPTLEAPTLLWMALTWADRELDIEELQWVKELGQRLPARSDDLGRMAAGGLSPDALTRLLLDADLATAVRLSEAAEQLVGLNHQQAALIYERHLPPCRRLPGEDQDLVQADRRAQLTASLTTLAELRGADVTAVFGDTEQRAVDAVASDPYGCRVSVEIRATTIEDAQTSLQRSWSYDTGRLCVITAVAFARLDGTDPVPSAYPRRIEKDLASDSAQTNLLARRLFDACPEADVVDVQLWRPHRQPQRIHGTDVSNGHRTLSAGVLLRERDTSRNVALQAAAADSVSSQHWTERCQAQALLAGQLLELLEEFPARVGPYLGARISREWRQRLELAHQAAVAMPPRPAPPEPVMSTAQAALLTMSASDEDQTKRSAARQDPARAAFITIASALSQAAEGHIAGNHQKVRGAADRLFDVLPELEEASHQGAPVFSGIGDTLPPRLTATTLSVAKLLSAVEEPQVVAALHRGAKRLDLISPAVDSVLQTALDDSLRAVTDMLHQAGADPARTAACTDPDPAPAWRDQQLVIAVPLDQWPTALEGIRAWSNEQREAAKARCRMSLVAVEDGEVLPIGMHVHGIYGEALPLTPERFPDFAEALGLPLRTNDMQIAVRDAVDQLTAYSYALVRRAHRTPGWSADPHQPPPPEVTAAEFAGAHSSLLEQAESSSPLSEREQARVRAAVALFKLCQLVAEENGTGPGLAAGLAALDPHHLVLPDDNPAVEVADNALAAAIEADRASYR
ncbi:hypothetical protein ACFW6K_28290 [Streptomyces sp. NPDC058733]|uniref:hypothetical protein n=1 Tax=Streptomyces sp. NPDC058733 TaxID=3346614 RepID=UPI0036D05127